MSENKNKKVSKRVLWTRILCLVLAFIMIGSVCYLAIQLIVEAAMEKKEHEGHDHASIAYTELANKSDSVGEVLYE